MSSQEERASDILQPLPLKEWPLLQNLFKADWPTYASYYYWIENTIKWKKRDPNLELDIYCPEGKYNDATFVGISSFSTYLVVVFTREPSGDRLRRGILETNRLDWSRGVFFAGLHEHIHPIMFSTLAELKIKRGVDIDAVLPSTYHFKSAEECSRAEVVVTDECYLAHLKECHVSIIEPLWPHRNADNPEESRKFLSAMVNWNRGVGLFLKADDTLVSWALHSDFHGLAIVQTHEEYKRKGYGKVVVTQLAKELGEEGISSILFVVKNNTPSEKMFQSLNWKPKNDFAWIMMKRLEIN